MDAIRIRGARVHNLKNIDVDIPKNKLVVLTGVSGSGKSSLAFDTLYAEGQRRYVESLSSYARQFLGIMEKPDVDSIDGLSPAISIDQKTASHNPRSTVGTVTEIYDYLRLLYARVGTPYCPTCHIPVRRMSADEITDEIVREMERQVSSDKARPHRFFIFSPVIQEKRGEFRELFDNLRYKGYPLVRIDGYFYDIDEEDLFILKNNKHTIDVVTDRLTLDNATLKDSAKMKSFRSRLFRAVENSLLLSEGLITLATVTDTGFEMPKKPENLIERIFSERFACPRCGMSFSEIEPRLFSFNSPLGACTNCKGLGTVLHVEPSRIYNPELTLAEGGVFPFARVIQQDTWFSRLVREVLSRYGISENIPLSRLSSQMRDILLFGTDEEIRVRGRNREGAMTSIHERFRGFAGEVEHRYYEATGDWAQGEYEKYMREEECDVCCGARLNTLALSVRIGSKNISELTGLSINETKNYLETEKQKLTGNETTIAQPITKEIFDRLHFLSEVGLSYLTLDRRANTLSGGEAQRIRLASQIGTGLTGITYVLDEPSIGLHSRDVSRLLTALRRLRDIGNSVIVVEHDWETMHEADHIIDFGPLAGKNGGNVIAQGTMTDIKNNSNSLTGQYLSGRKHIKRKVQSVNDTHALHFHGCSKHNLKNISFRIPLGNLVGVTGVSGSGKSTLLLDTVYSVLSEAVHQRQLPEHVEKVEGLSHVERVILIDQSPIGRTPRSNPATYTGVFSPIRDVFAQTSDAKARGYLPGRFSFNVRGGRCEHCEGAGAIKVEMQFLADLYVPCDVCKGTRYNKETLEVLYKGKSIADVLRMTVDDAFDFFEHHNPIIKILSVLRSVGLGYMELGQSAPTLSGGEAQRVKLAKELYTSVSTHTIYLLDEPTTGLHFYDVDKLITVLRHLVEQGNTVAVIEHNLDVIKNCDWIIDLGPEGGEGGGSVLFEGPGENIVNEKASHTGTYMREYLHANR